MNARVTVGIATLLAAILVSGSVALATQAPSGPHSLPPKLQLRYQHLTSELRCPVCQNEAISVSQSKIAANLRRIVREKLLAGESDQAIRAYMVSRYGLFAVYDPPVTSGTWLLWFGPLILLIIAGTVGVVALRRRRRLLTPVTEKNNGERP